MQCTTYRSDQWARVHSRFRTQSGPNFVGSERGVAPRAKSVGMTAATAAFVAAKLASLKRCLRARRFAKLSSQDRS
jgi:hypothetical protein